MVRLARALAGLPAATAGARSARPGLALEAISSMPVHIGWCCPLEMFLMRRVHPVIKLLSLLSVAGAVLWVSRLIYLT
jgi:hypothetical protein